MKPTIKDELLDELLEHYNKPEDLTGPEGILSELKQRLISRVLDSEAQRHRPVGDGYVRVGGRDALAGR